MHKKYKCQFLKHLLKYIIECHVKKKYKCQFLKHFLKYIIECHGENKYKCQFLRHFLKYISLFNSEKNINVNSSDNLVLSVKFPLAINKFLDQYYNFLKQSTFKTFFNYKL